MPAESHFAGIVFLCASFSIQQIRRHDLLLRSACTLWIRQAALRQCQKISKLFFAIALGLHSLDKTGCASAMSKNQRAVFLLLRSACTIFV